MWWGVIEPAILARRRQWGHRDRGMSFPPPRIDSAPVLLDPVTLCPFSRQIPIRLCITNLDLTTKGLVDAHACSFEMQMQVHMSNAFIRFCSFVVVLFPFEGPSVCLPSEKYIRRQA